MDFLGIGFPELLLILFLALIFVGPDKLPGFARDAGKFMSTLKAKTSEITKQITEELDKEVKEATEEARELKQDVAREIKTLNAVAVDLHADVKALAMTTHEPIPPAENLPDGANENKETQA